MRSRTLLLLCVIAAIELLPAEDPNRVSSHNAAGRSPSDPVTPQWEPVPILPLAALDISGTAPNGQDVKLVALDDTNQAAFMWESDASGQEPAKYNTRVWKNGAYQGPVKSMNIEQVVDAQHNLRIRHYASEPASPWTLMGSVLTTSGGLFGIAFPIPPELDDWIGEEWDQSQEFEQGHYFFQWTGSSPTPLRNVPYSDRPGPGFAQIWAGNNTGFGITNSGSAIWRNGQWHGYEGQFAGYYSGHSMNEQGVVVGTGSEVWSGTTYTTLNDGGWGWTFRINNQNHVTGYNSSNHAVLWRNGHNAAPEKIQDLLPPKYQNHIKDIVPLLLSNAAAPPANTLRIVFTGKNLEGQDPDIWTNRTFLLTLTGTTSKVAVLKLPESVTLDANGFQFLNTSGLLAAIGTLTATGPDGNPTTSAKKALLLLPFELVDTKDKVFDDQAPQGTTITDAMRDVNIEPKATVEEQKERSIAWIEPHGEDNGNNGPDMPQLALRFRGTEQMGLKIKWKLEVIYDRPRGTSPNETRIKAQDEVFIPKKTSGSQPWREEALDGAVEFFNHQDWIAELQEKGFFGGEAKLTYYLLKADGSALGAEEIMLFSIGGKNPDPAKCKEYIDGNATSAHGNMWFAYAIAKSESVPSIPAKDIVSFGIMAATASARISRVNRHGRKPVGKRAPEVSDSSR